MIRHFQAPVVDNTPLPAPGHFVIRFHAPELAASVRPGHFVTIGALDGGQLLRRPFSIYTTDITSGDVTILYNVRGPTSQAMAQRRPGDSLDVVGPLGGRVFTPDPRPGTRHIMIGGGYGVPPLVFLARTVRESDPGADVIFINGARNQSFLVGTEGIEDMGGRLILCTDDGSCGYHGRVTGVLDELFDVGNRVVQVYTYGPTPMMRAVAEMAIAANVACQVSLEVYMPCGIGICMGCAVLRPDGTYARGCYEGPVFDAREVVWEAAK